MTIDHMDNHNMDKLVVDACIDKRQFIGISTMDNESISSYQFLHHYQDNS